MLRQLILVVRALNMNPIVQKVLLASGLIPATLTAITPFFVVPSFTQVFSAFGTDLPQITSLVLHFYGLVVVLPFMVLIAWHFWPNPNRRGIAACSIGVGGSFLVSSIMVFAMYWPIFEMSPSV
jgi:type II secretory pathway component PulF